MTTDELIQPRYKVIADYPNSTFQVDEIIYPNEHGHILIWDDTGAWNLMPPSYPHLFKQLQWWEDRKPEDMPKYVKWIDTRPLFERQKGTISEVTNWELNSRGKLVCDIFPNYIPVDFLNPASEQEYNDYLASTTRQD